jgi:Domain of unknown function (DUF5753)
MPRFKSLQRFLRALRCMASLHVLVRVAELSQRPGVVIQVVLSAKGANARLCGTFDLATTADGDTTLRVDGIEDQSTEDKALISKAIILFDLIRGNALPRDESRSLILEIGRCCGSAPPCGAGSPTR